MAESRIFDNTQYILERTYSRKSNATAYANHQRSIGHLARIVKRYGGYAIYTHWRK